MRNQTGKKGEDVRSESRRRALRNSLQEGIRKKANGRNRKLSSGKLKRKRTKGSGRQAFIPKKRFEGNHLWNGCGSEAGQNERKPSGKPSRRTWKERMRNQAGNKGESDEAKAESHTVRTTVR